jgi:hypothetical protein
MIVPTQLALKTNTNLGCAASFTTLDKLVDKLTLPPAALPIGDASLTHVIKLAAHSTMSPTPTAMPTIMTPYKLMVKLDIYPSDSRFKNPRNYTYTYAVHHCFKHAGGHDIFLLDWRQVLSYDVSLLNIRLVVNSLIDLV